MSVFKKIGNAFKSVFGGGDSSKQVAALQQQLVKQQQDQHQEMVALAERQRQEMLADEQRRQGNIRGGMSKIDDAFAQFGDPYFQGAQQRYLDYYLPQIGEQAGRARDQLTARLAERGMLESSTGIGALADLEKRGADERARIGSEAVNFSGGLRDQVQRSKGSLYELAQTAADPNAVASRATGEATTLAQAPGGFQQQPIGNVFADLLAPFAHAVRGKQNRLPSGFTASAAPLTGSGTASVYG